MAFGIICWNDLLIFECPWESKSSTDTLTSSLAPTPLPHPILLISSGYIIPLYLCPFQYSFISVAFAPFLLSVSSLSSPFNFFIFFAVMSEVTLSSSSHTLPVSLFPPCHLPLCISCFELYILLLSFFPPCFSNLDQSGSFFSPFLSVTLCFFNSLSFIIRWFKL